MPEIWKTKLQGDRFINRFIRNRKRTAVILLTALSKKTTLVLFFWRGLLREGFPQVTKCCDLQPVITLADYAGL